MEQIIQEHVETMSHIDQREFCTNICDLLWIISITNKSVTDWREKNKSARCATRADRIVSVGGRRACLDGFGLIVEIREEFQPIQDLIDDRRRERFFRVPDGVFRQGLRVGS